jgi:hypothetical protein
LGVLRRNSHHSTQSKLQYYDELSTQYYDELSTQYDDEFFAT